MTQMIQCTNIGAVHNPSDCETSFVDETKMNSWENGKAPESSKQGGEKKGSVNSPGKDIYTSFFRDNRIPEDKSKLEFIQPGDGEFVVHFDEIDLIRLKKPEASADLVML